MVLRRELWGESYVESAPAWPCPSCADGRLRLIPESVQQHASKAFRVSWDLGAAADDDEEGSFTAHFNCISCDEWVAVAGTYRAESVEWINRDEYRVRMRFAPRAIVPPPPLIELPDSLPPPVADSIAKAFLLFWSDLEACANRIRSSVELILTRIGIPRTRVVTKKGTGTKKRERLRLHTRIERLEASRPELAQTLLAIKWIGNEGSHETTGREAVLDAFEILEHAVEMIWGRRQERVRSIVRVVNRRKRPR